MAQNYEQWTATDAIDKSLLDNDIQFQKNDNLDVFIEIILQGIYIL